MINSKVTTIGDICKRFSSGSGISASEIYSEGKYPVYGGNGLRGYTNSYNFDGECAIIGRQGAYCGNVRYFKGKAWMTEHAIIACARNEHNTGFLAYKLSLMNLNQYQGQSAQPGLSVNTLSKLKIDLPDLEVQNKVFHLLKTIDDKVMLNSLIISELESLAKTIYNYWFLQFEFPNDEGKPYKSSGGKMVWNDELNGEIPVDWGVFNFTNTKLCKLIQPGVEMFTFKNYLATSNVNYENITDGTWIQYNNRETRANMQPIEKSVWFAKMKNSIKHISIPSNSDWFTEKYILSTGFVGLRCSEVSFAYIHSIVNSYNFEKRKDILAHGATQEAVNNEDLKNMKYVLPKTDILSLYALKIDAVLKLKFNMIRENQVLSSLLDFLRPILINGQATFKT